MMSEGLLIYTGDSAAMADWFARFGLIYSPESHGPVTDWVLDLVTVGFEKARAVDGEAGEGGERFQARGDCDSVVPRCCCGGRLWCPERHVWEGDGVGGGRQEDGRRFEARSYDVWRLCKPSYSL